MDIQPTRPANASTEELRRVGLFGALGDEALAYLSARLVPHELGPGEFAFREGDTGADFYVLLDGEMEVLKTSQRGTPARVAVLGPGDWFGEMSVLDVQPRSASVCSTAATRLLCISAADLDALYRWDLKAYSLVVLNLARELSRRLRVADSLLADFVTNVVQRAHPPAS